MQTDIDTLPAMSEQHTKVKKIMEGLQPRRFQELIVKKNPWAMAKDTVEDIVATIAEECMTEQETTDRFKAGYGSTVNGGGGGCGGGGGGGWSGSGAGGHNRGGRNDAKGDKDEVKGGRGKNFKKCFNCDGDHRITQCTELCRKCVPSCGRKIQECPVYVKYKAAPQAKGRERTPFLNRK